VDESFGQPARVEPPADGARVSRLAGQHRCTERFEPIETVVQAIDHERLQPGVSVRALGAKLLERVKTPDEPAREQHRPAWTVALFEHHRRISQFARTGSSAEPGHTRTGDRQHAFR